MARWKKPSKEEVRELRQILAERARHGALRLPRAVLEIRKSIGMTQEEFAKRSGLPADRLPKSKPAQETRL